jgi:hypothetical protein
MSTRTNKDRIQRSVGSQPVIFKDAQTDALTAMVLALLGEVVVLRDRLDAHERLSARQGGFGPAEVDDYRPDEAARAPRARLRQATYDRVLGAARDKLLPQALQEQHDYDHVVSDVSTDQDREN